MTTEEKQIEAAAVELQESITDKLRAILGEEGVEILTEYVWHMLISPKRSKSHITQELQEFLADETADFVDWILSHIVPQVDSRVLRAPPANVKEPERSPQKLSGTEAIQSVTSSGPAEPSGERIQQQHEAVSHQFNAPSVKGVKTHAATAASDFQPSPSRPEALRSAAAPREDFQVDNDRGYSDTPSQQSLPRTVVDMKKTEDKRGRMLGLAMKQAAHDSSSGLDTRSFPASTYYGEHGPGWRPAGGRTLRLRVRNEPVGYGPPGAAPILNSRIATTERGAQRVSPSFHPSPTSRFRRGLQGDADFRRGPHRGRSRSQEGRMMEDTAMTAAAGTSLPPSGASSAHLRGIRCRPYPAVSLSGGGGGGADGDFLSPLQDQALHNAIPFPPHSYRKNLRVEGDMTVPLEDQEAVFLDHDDAPGLRRQVLMVKSGHPGARNGALVPRGPSGIEGLPHLPYVNMHGMAAVPLGSMPPRRGYAGMHPHGLYPNGSGYLPSLPFPMGTSGITPVLGDLSLNAPKEAAAVQGFTLTPSGVVPGEGELNADPTLAPSPPNTLGTHKKLKKRCMKWPACPFGEQCRYIHPAEMCNNWPYCPFGTGCFYIHPEVPCKFGLNCHNPGCNYVHPDNWDPTKNMARQSFHSLYYQNKTLNLVKQPPKNTSNATSDPGEVPTADAPPSSAIGAPEPSDSISQPLNVTQTNNASAPSVSSTVAPADATAQAQILSSASLAPAGVSCEPPTRPVSYLSPLQSAANAPSVATAVPVQDGDVTMGAC